MRLTNSFEIARDIGEVFETFLDVEAVARCLPGATLTKLIDKENFEGEVKVKVGPLAVRYAGSASLLGVDEEGRTLSLRAKGREASGSGNADALVKATLSSVDGGTKVDIDTDLSIRGKVAQFGRGAIAEVSGSLMRQFARNVEQLLESGARPGSGGPADDSADQPAAGQRTDAEPAVADDSISALTLLKPLLARAASLLGPALAAGLAAYVGARLGRRR